MSDHRGMMSDGRQVRNVYCIGRNYRLHAAELGNAVPEQPMVFLKPSHAVITMEADTALPLPLDRGAVHHEVELVLRLGSRVEPGMTAAEAVDAFALGIDFTLRDVQDVLKKKGHPWLAAKGVLNSAPVTRFLPFPGTETLERTNFAMHNNGRLVQEGRAEEMLFSLDTLIEYTGRHYGLGAGDLLFTGTPAGVGPVQAGDRLELSWGGELLGSCVVAAQN
ncbi:fumarylacetoacetate hydrolase family protein [Paenibacillus melissococcoides]|uniref:Fumarylacetoacetate hydrolase family protein n=1 Tax=Paenibacillus melissococcoides TaxID=2912268 RepID=A0ABN8U7E5_9BACL|nr:MULTISPECIES: fumarylacetoacetate hydrolase family protein [Paenibacillus]MEB9897436.1 fumarylacetoacetate hydrolase family protein [Bacillus cereus]CAH8247000.1 fumarylacetoacetate hydrolase family protein [Paenibacillus melissococcoides]CAH8716444.1 fumarylacetoacetate hydrolase family protein [Paenibacillus melissococcoides]CAH8717428.1 fumarylacetoacetate hydrolase family protein [Paenibacillus melissococcoides]GIO76589.1 fumarylacetoacetate hydrolase [Paenibacillus dendritiformis]